ncbi:MAG: carbamoyl phosphate synthase small subunit [Oscillospiraceae bacterium]|nr:carbamoyl phosphate synthase small subunit [Oscillospiraceae bacterium]
MANKAYLILENGTIFEGKSIGASGDVVGEIVFTTGMTGYLETVTDSSYHGQMIVQTFPLIGNYGVIPADFEAPEIAARAYIIKHPCQDPSNFRCEGELDIFLRERGVIGLSGIDTRKLTKLIRDNGVMNGKITTTPPTAADQSEAKAYTISNAVAAVSPRGIKKIGGEGRKVVMLNLGAKNSIANALIAHGCEVWSFPHDASAEDILAANPDGIVLSNGPGNPAAPENKPIIDTIAKLDISGIPIFGIGLGHQLLAIVKGYKTEKMKFGNRGGNQPVKDLKTGRVYNTGQNHGYAVIADDSWFINVNDDSCEGLDYGSSFSVQFYPGSTGGPLDTEFLFNVFAERMEK